MRIDRRTFSSTLLIGGLTASSFGRALAAPSDKQIRIICPFAPGGGTDLLTRIVAVRLGERIGQPVVVENRAGAGGTLAHQYVATSKPDGSVLLLGAIGPLSIAPHLSKLPYDPQRDLAPLTMGAVFPNVLVVNAGLGVKTLGEFVALAKKKPGSLDFASTGAGSAAHLAGELFNVRAGIDTVHIPYKGGAPALQDLLGGRIAAYYSTPPTAQPHIESGKLVALATTGLTRPAGMEQVPTIAESGYPGFKALNWYAFMAPGKTPVPELDRLNGEIVAVLRSPEVQSELLRHGLTPQPSSRVELAQYIASESTVWGQLIRERKITGD